MVLVSRIVIPPAYIEMIMSSRPPSRREHLGTNRGVNDLSRSRGTVISMSPVSEAAFFGYDPLREFVFTFWSRSPVA